MKVGFMLPVGESVGGLLGWPALRELVECGEAQGLDSVWVADHLLYRPPDGGDTLGLHEAWTLMSAIAGITERIEIAPLVICAAFRSPGMVAKMATTLDSVSGGRFTLGVGAGWHDPEFEAFGFPADYKVSRFEEWLEIVARLLRGERVTFEGRYHSVHDLALAPRPDRRIPVLVASHRPRMHGLAARWGDAWNTAWYGFPNDQFRERVAGFDAALAAEGRDPAEVERTVGIVVREEVEEGDIPLAGSPKEIAAALDRYDELGFGHAIAFLEPTTPDSIERLAAAVRLRRG